jgi:transcription elongation GreA/GreB family factor
MDKGGYDEAGQGGARSATEERDELNRRIAEIEKKLRNASQ